MPITAITGQLGEGKTLTLTYIGLRALRIHGKNIFANYHIKYKIRGKIYIPEYIGNPGDIEKLHNGMALLDEWWAWVDSRDFGTKSNRIGSMLALISRKVDLDIAYTSQDLSFIEKRIRLITNYEAVPVITGNICKVFFFQLSHGKRIRLLDKYFFYCDKIHNFYNTKEIKTVKKYTK